MTMAEKTDIWSQFLNGTIPTGLRPATPSGTGLSVACGYDNLAYGQLTQGISLEPPIIFPGDSGCYTVKQVDEYLESSGLSGFALESERNRLIGRLRSRLAAMSGQGTLPFDERNTMLMELGYARYEKAADMLELGAVPPPLGLPGKFVGLANALHEKGIAMEGLNFLFTHDELEMMFRTRPGMEFSVIAEYDHPGETHAMCTFTRGIDPVSGVPDVEVLSASISPFSADDMVKFIGAVTARLSGLY